MKKASLTLLTFLVTLTALSATAADDPIAQFTRMAGTYADRSVTFRQQVSGNSESVFPGSMALRMPRRAGAVKGSLRVPGQSFQLQGRIISAKIAGRSVRYAGRLNLVFPGGTLSQRSFRATAQPKGARKEVLVSNVKLGGGLMGTSLVIRANFRGAK